MKAMEQKALRIVWTCSDHMQHQHRFKWVAYLCGRWQYLISKKATLRISEGEAYPWWGRQWRYNYATDTRDVLPIPLCWLARAVWKLWLLSYRVRPTAWEIELRRARRAGFKGGIARKCEIHREVADDLFERIQRLRLNEQIRRFVGVCIVAATVAWFWSFALRDPEMTQTQLLLTYWRYYLAGLGIIAIGALLAGRW